MMRSFAVVVLMVAGVMVGGAAHATGVPPGGTLTCTHLAEILQYPAGLWEANPSANQWRWKIDGIVKGCTGNSGDTIVYTTFSASGTHPGPGTCSSAQQAGYQGRGTIAWYTIDAQTHRHKYSSRVTLSSLTENVNTGLVTSLWTFGPRGPFANTTFRADAQITPYPPSLRCLTATDSAGSLFALALENPTAADPIHIP